MEGESQSWTGEPQPTEQERGTICVGLMRGFDQSCDLTSGRAGWRRSMLHRVLMLGSAAVRREAAG